MSQGFSWRFSTRATVLVAIFGFNTLAAAPAFGLTLEELKAELARRNIVGWQAGQTAATTEYLTLAAERKKALEVAGKSARSSIFGLREGAHDSTIEVAPEDFRTDESLPPSLDWRSKDGRDFTSPVRNQARCGSCVAFAAMGAFETQLNIAAGNAALDLDLSEQDLFARIGSCDSGSMPFMASSTLKSSGAPDESCFPYASGRLGKDFDTDLACADRAARTLKITGSRSVSASQAKAALQNGPLMTTMTVYEDFMFYTGGVYEHVTGEALGGHAVTIVGYDDAAQAWIVRNSWGAGWGESGYFRIKYTDASGVGRSNTAFTVANPNFQVKVASPADRAVLRGDAALTLTDLTVGEAVSFADWKITNIKTSQTIGGSTDPARDPEVIVDSDSVADGTYHLAVYGRDHTGAQSKPFYTTVYVVNAPQPLAATLTPDFDSTVPVKDRVYFDLKSTFGAVPPTAASFFYSQRGGNAAGVVDVLDPGDWSKVGWRTATIPNGEYDVWAVVRIGDVQEVTTTRLTFTVANEQ